MSSGKTKLSVVICSWQVREHIERCLRRLFDVDHGVDLEVVLVDNDSTDGTVEMVLAEFPAVTLIENRANVGFPQANNQGLELVTGELVLFLNPDTEVGDGTLLRCVRELEANPDLGMVGCRLIWPDGDIQYYCARRAYRLGDVFIEALYLHKFFPNHPFFGRQLLGDWDHLGVRDVEGISGAFMMMPTKLARRLGGMATDVFLYHEDMDLCLRVRQAGYRIRYLGDVVTTHYMSRSTAGAWQNPNWALLELEVRVRLIRQIQGDAAAAVARAAYGARSLARMGIATAGRLLPGKSGVRERYPLVFDLERHLLQLRWALSPQSHAHLLPRAPRVDEAPPATVHAARRS